MQDKSAIIRMIDDERAYYATGKTRPIDQRIAALGRLEESILSHEDELYRALRSDLGKSRTESYMCEVGLSLRELRYIKKHIRRWSRDRAVPTPLALFPAKSFVVNEPYGVVLIMSPWNYPVLLTLTPLVGALAAGNCAMIKPSAYAPETSLVLKALIGEAFSPEYVCVVTGGRDENQYLLDEAFDYIFFTGGVNVGRLVMQKASVHLTPVTLELGGKSPCIIEKSADIDLAARRVAFGKYLNSGQTCVAPDYVLIEDEVHDRFLAALKKEITGMFGETPLLSPDYGKIINRKHFDRVMGLIDPAKLVIGGECDADTLRIAPTVMDGVTADDAVMREEIFGPILPVLRVADTDEALRFINARPKPLALYIFTSDRAIERKFLYGTSYGGGCINDTVMHLASSEMGFGGVGISGMGSYHGKKSFETFSHAKSIVRKYKWPDLSMRYRPYTEAGDKLIRMFLR